MAVSDPGVDYYLYSCRTCDLVLLQERGHLSEPQKRKKKLKHSSFNLDKFYFLKKSNGYLFLNFTGINLRSLLT